MDQKKMYKDLLLICWNVCHVKQEIEYCSCSYVSYAICIYDYVAVCILVYSYTGVYCII